MRGWPEIAVGTLLVLARTSAAMRATDDAAPRPVLPARVTQETLAAHELRTLCLDVLGRPPLEAERAEWRSKSRAELVDLLLGTREAWEHWYREQLYYFLLIDNFQPRSERLDALPAELLEGRADVRSAVHRIALSTGFERRNPGADTFVTVVLEQLAGLDVKKNPRELDIGRRVYDGAEGTFLGQPARTQADIVRVAVESPAFARHLVEREYARLLHAAADPRSAAAWAARLHEDPRAHRELVRGWLAGPEYAQRLARTVPEENRLFVRALYVDLLDRRPTEAEAEPLREALDGLSDPAPLRAVIARLLLDSADVRLPERSAIPDPGAWIDELFVRLLGRAPAADERASFVAAFADPACRPQTVVQALVSTAEYARY